ncbi:MAG: sodium-dependent transporter, partial [Planctomycetes bacterium]|nr:sodium-dependent transporter [Planctomycetota bacterium]
MTAEESRSTFSSSWGTVLTTAGVAIGLGNIWRFPYMMGEYGGAVFLIVYLGIVIAFALPALMVEWALGRHTRRGTWGAFQRAGLPGGRWFSYLLLITVTMAASYYGVVLAWVFYFAVAFASSPLTTRLAPDFGLLHANVGAQAACVAVTVTLGCGALFFGVKRGIERISKLALPVFFLLFAILIVRSLTLDGAMAGLREFLVPRWGDFTGATALAALGQAFFSLALGGTFMVIYGSYMRSEENIPKTAVLTAAADVGAALMAGLIVVPAALALGVSL